MRNHSVLGSPENDKIKRLHVDLTDIYLLKFNNKTRKMCEICSKLMIKTPENVIDAILVSDVSVIIVNFKQVSHFF